MFSNSDKFAIRLESDKGLEKLYTFLKKNKDLEDFKLGEIKNDLRLLKRRFGFRNYEEMLAEFEQNQNLLHETIKSLNKKDSSTIKGTSQITLFSKRKKTLKDYINLPDKGKRKKKKKKKKNIRLVNLEDKDIFMVSTPQDTQNLQPILELLSRKKINYEAYKETYFLRRIQTRMRKIGIRTYRDYRNYLENNPQEPKMLVSSFSINVTHFFRDRDLFIELQRKVIPQILESKSVHIWSAGCAVGPEPYSIAMLIYRLGVKKQPISINILATDISQEFLDQAILGRYPRELLKELDPSEIQEFFLKLDNDEFQLNESIRNYVKFKKHDLRTQPPGSDFDLILCRNVLIYFSRSQSKQLFKRFHSSLKSRGYLVIGSCELLHPSVKDKFETIDTQNRIYRRLD
ncbi:MAG: CheR family methyltransferase [Candidatus Hodarchaeota archaeon]